MTVASHWLCGHNADTENMTTERSPEGEQHLISGVRPITERERLQALADRPPKAKGWQQAPNFDLFDEDARMQSNLF